MASVHSGGFLCFLGGFSRMLSGFWDWLEGVMEAEVRVSACLVFSPSHSNTAAGRTWLKDILIVVVDLPYLHSSFKCALRPISPAIPAKQSF